MNDHHHHHHYQNRLLLQGSDLKSHSRSVTHNKTTNRVDRLIVWQALKNTEKIKRHNIIEWWTVREEIGVDERTFIHWWCYVTQRHPTIFHNMSYYQTMNIVCGFMRSCSSKRILNRFLLVIMFYKTKNTRPAYAYYVCYLSVREIFI